MAGWQDSIGIFQIIQSCISSLCTTIRENPTTRESQYHMSVLGNVEQSISTKNDFPPQKIYMFSSVESISHREKSVEKESGFLLTQRYLAEV